MTPRIKSIATCLQFLTFAIAICLVGCHADEPTPQPEVKDTRPSLGPQPDPTRDEAAELIKACGLPDTDTKQTADSHTERIMSWRKYGVDFYLYHGNDSPLWATTGVFLKGSQSTIERKTLSRKMPCASKVKLYTLDEMAN